MSQKYLKTVILSSIVIMVYQGIANSDLGIISQFTHQNGNDWAGPLCTALLFLGSGLGSSYNKYIHKYQYRYCFFVGSFGYVIFIFLGLVFIKLGFSIAIEVLIFVLSFIAGLMASIFYTSQFNYINVLSKIDNNQIKYFGICMALAQCSGIFGNLLSSMLIKQLSQFLTVLILGLITFFTSFCFLLFVQPSKKEIEQIQNQTLLSAQGKDQTEDIQSVITVNYQKKSLKVPLIIVCSFCFSGLIIAFIFVDLSIIIYQTFENDMDESKLNYLTFVLFIFEGVGQFLGGLTMILFSQKIKDQLKFLMGIHFLFLISVAIIYVSSRLQNQYLMGAGIVLTGFCDCSCYVLTLTIAGEWQQKGILMFNIGQCISVAISVMLMVFVSFQVVLIWIGLYYIWNLISLLLYRRSLSPQQSIN